ncbi:MAG TPA: hypothetical protein VE422_26840 [Terriglobia bacterium]|jgi:hypothetical protein|nr:hypothetical protein [Terriglobia bacterium]
MSRRLVAVWLLFVALAIAIVLIERQQRAVTSAEEGSRDARRLLPAELADLGAIEVMHKGTLHRFERDSAGAWFYHGIHTGSEQQHAHNADPAVAAQIEKAFTGFGRTRMERQFPLNIQADEFQVTRPDIFIMVYRPKEMQPLARYAVGIVAPDGVSRYVLPVGSTYVVTIANYQIDNLLNLIRAVGGKSGQGNPKK